MKGKPAARKTQRRGTAGGKSDRNRSKKVRGYSARRELALEQVREEQARVDAWIASQSEPVATADAAQLVGIAQQGRVAPARVSPEVLVEDAGSGVLIEVVFTTGITSDDPWDGMLPMDAGSVVKRLDWSLGDARQLVRQGYTPERAATVTGWPVALTEDVRIGKWA